MESRKSAEPGNLGSLIKARLRANSLSMRRLGLQCGLDVATISRIVSGKQQPKLSHLKLFAEHLQVPIDRLIEASGYGWNAAGREGRREGEPPESLSDYESVLAMLGHPDSLDPAATRSRIEQELAHYEQLAGTLEGRRAIEQEFEAKMAQLNGQGPFIEVLHAMYRRFADPETPAAQRTLLGSGLLYFIRSADIIPDHYFPLGYVDDAMAIRSVLERLEILEEGK